MRIITGIAEAPIDADRDIDDIARVEDDFALTVAFEPIDLPFAFEGDEYLLGRVAMERRAASLGGAGISHRKTVSGRFDLRGEVGVFHILGHAHPDDVDDLAPIGWDPLVEKRDVRPLRPVEARGVVALHLRE